MEVAKAEEKAEPIEIPKSVKEMVKVMDWAKVEEKPTIEIFKINRSIWLLFKKAINII
jgi:hypothetical protein